MAHGGGNRVRVYHLLRNLAARGHRITLVIQAANNYADAQRELAPLVDRLIVLPRRRRLRRVMMELLQEPWDIVQVPTHIA